MALIAMQNLFSGLITSKTRIKLIVRLFFNPGARAYLRELAGEFNLSSNAVREELNQLKKTNLLISEKSGRNIFYRANPDHPLFPELTSMVAKTLGMDRVIDGIVNRLGQMDAAYLIDDYAEGKDSGIIDLLLVGDIDRHHLDDLSRKTEKYINRKIRTMVMTGPEFVDNKKLFEDRPILLIWQHKGQVEKISNAESLEV
jgi:DNA-binding transcriptional ArsR family regulator